MAVSDAQKKAAAKWDKENMTTLGCKVKKSEAEQFKSYAKEQGTTANNSTRQALKYGLAFLLPVDSCISAMPLSDRILTRPICCLLTEQYNNQRRNAPYKPRIDLYGAFAMF